MSNFNFEKNKRLLSAQSFQSVFENTDFKISNSNFLLLAHQNKLKHARLGMIVAKKSIRFSVNRNRLKRVIRSSFRVNQQNLSSLDIIFLVRKGMNKLSFREQTELVTKGLDQLHKKLQNIS
jgi:ribonuclease P protein component